MRAHRIQFVSMAAKSNGWLWRLCLGLLVGINTIRSAPVNYVDPPGYPTSWPAQLQTQAYTYLGQVQSDVSAYISGRQDPSQGATPQQATDFSSGAANNQSSFNYFANGAVLYFRLRLAGPPMALTGSGQPFTSATWNLLLDIDGDGWKEFVIELDGTDGGTAPDDLVVIYDNSSSQKFIIGSANVWRQDSARHPTDRSGDGVNGESGSSAN
jgi:hypothetical protein